MGRYLLCGKEAVHPYVIEDLDLRIRTIEELCFYIFNDPALIDDDFIDERLILFIRNELELTEIADKIARFYTSPADQDATLKMLLSDVGYYTEAELSDFNSRLVQKRRRSPVERIREKGDSLLRKKRYQAALRTYRTLAGQAAETRLGRDQYVAVLESMANAYGRLGDFERSMDYLGTIYDTTKSERILKKMYDVSVLSGGTLPEKYFAFVPDNVLAAWQKDYWNREAACKESADESEEMQLFLKDPDNMKTNLRQLVKARREEYRRMLE